MTAKQEQIMEIKEMARIEARMYDDVDFAIDQLFSSDMTVTEFRTARSKLVGYGHEAECEELLDYVVDCTNDRL